MGRSEEQAARNESVFRDANDRIAERRADLAAVDGLTPFLCECEDETCTAIVRMSLADYRAVRSDAANFLVVPGHPTSGTEGSLSGDGWVCVRKDGRAAEVARALEDADGRT